MNSCLMDVLHPSTLGQDAFKTHIDRQSKRWGVPVDGVVFPIVTAAGATYESALIPSISSVAGGTTSLTDVSVLARESHLKLWLSFDTHLSFLQSDVSHKKDFQGDASAESCIVSPASQRAAALLIEEALTTINEAGGQEAAGLVVPIQDLWGMSADNDILSLTCFCVHCREELRQRGIDLSNFKGHPNPWNLLLKDNVGGIGYIDHVFPASTPEDIVAVSLEKQFHAYRAIESAKEIGADPEEKKRNADEAYTRLLTMASHLRAYMHAMTDITKAAVVKICEPARQRQLKCAVVVGSEPYDWSNRIFFEDLDDPEFVDEVWCEPSNVHGFLEKVDYRNYFHKRSRYSLDAFFEIVDMIGQDRPRVLMGLSDDRARRQLARRLDLAVVGAYRSRLDFESAPAGDRCVGAVFPVFDRDIAESIAEQLLGADWRPEEAETPTSTTQMLADLESLLRRTED